MANIQDTETLVCLCLLRPFEEVTVNDDPLKNDIDCPLLNFTNTIVAVSPMDIKTEVSIMHECNTTCTFDNSGVIEVERESIAINRLSYIHLD